MSEIFRIVVEVGLVLLVLRAMNWRPPTKQYRPYNWKHDDGLMYLFNMDEQWPRRRDLDEA